MNIVANVLPSRKADLLSNQMKIANNLIVIGDQLGDLEVTHQLKDKNVVSIGFLNHKRIEKRYIILI